MVLAALPASAIVRSSIVVDAQTGAVLEEHDADRLTYPASLAKLMTLYLTFQQLSTGNLTLLQPLSVSAHAAEQSPMKLWLHAGSEISVESAILGVTTRSANDAAVVLAEAVGGNETKFAALMTREARRLGMEHTTFCNASGLPDPRQQTTARDLATLALAILHDYPQYYHFFKAQSFVFHGQVIRGHDHLLGRYPGVDGMKTGYIRASGFNLVTSSVQDGRRLVGVVLGGESIYSRDRLMVSLLDRCFLRDTAPAVMASAAEPHRALPKRAEYARLANEPLERPAVARGGEEWYIQIGGAYRNRHAGKRVLRRALRAQPRALEGARPVTVRSRRRIYYARFSNLTERRAVRTCQLLRRKRFGCRAVRMRASGLALASTGS